MDEPRTIDKDKITAQIMLLSREPFQELLGMILGCQPDEKSLEVFAKRQPDRWGQLVAIVGRLSGFGDKVEVNKNVNVFHMIHNMSDMELRQYQAELERKSQELMDSRGQKALPANPKKSLTNHE